MDIIEIVITSVGLAMDSCTMAICLGISMKKFKIKETLYIGFWFGLFQALMPLIGYLLGNTFAWLIYRIDHWIAFFILSFIGINMIKESTKKTYIVTAKDLSTKGIIILAIATSIDALAVGITFSFLQINMKIAFVSIGIITFILSILGVKIGNTIFQKLLEDKYEKYVSQLGGIILIGIGFKILIEHLTIV